MLILLCQIASINEQPEIYQHLHLCQHKLSIQKSVTLLSPVMTMTRMPAPRQFLIASITSVRGGSNIPTTPTNVQFVCNKV
jgi:hypothetical protein